MIPRSSIYAPSLFDQTDPLSGGRFGASPFGSTGQTIQDPHQGHVLHSAGQRTAMEAKRSLAMRQHQSRVQQRLRQEASEQRMEYNRWLVQSKVERKPVTFSIVRSKSNSDRLRHERLERLSANLPNTVDKESVERMRLALSPPTVDNINTAEQYNQLPTGTVIRSGKYKGIKLGEVLVTRANGTILQTRRDYQEYIIRKYPYTAAMHLTNAGRYGPWNPEAVAIEVSGGVDAIFLSVSFKAGLAFNSYQFAPYGSIGTGGGTPSTELPGFGVSTSFILSDKTTDATLNHNLGPVAGIDFGHSLNLGPLALGRSQSMATTPDGLQVDPTGYTNYSFGIGSGFGYRRELATTYFLFGKPIQINQPPASR